MAESMTPEEIQRAFDAYNQELLLTGRVTRETREAFNDAKAGVKNYTFELNKSLKALGNSSIGLGQALLKGEQGASVFNNSLNAGADALDAFLSKFGFLGKMLGTVLTAGARYVVEVNKQSDALFQTYQKLSKVGAANASGLSGIAETVQKFGMTLSDADLEKFTSLVSTNSEALSRLGGSVNQGVKTFGDVADGIHRSGLQTEFLRMGMTVGDINTGMAGYLKITTLTGSANKLTTAQLTQGAADYVKQLDLLTKLTGKSAEALVREQEEDLANERYALVQRELSRKAAEGDEAAKKQMVQNELLMRQDMSKETKIAIQNAIAGYGASSEEGAKLLRTSTDAFNKLASGTFEATDVMNLLQRDSKKYLDQFGELGKATGDLSKTFLSVQDAMKFEGLKGTAEERVAAAKKQQEAQTQYTEAAVANQVALRQEQVSITQASQKLITLGLNPVTGAMSKLAGVTEKVVTSLPGTGNRGTSGTGRGNEQAAGILGSTQPVPNAAPATAPAAAPAPAPAPSPPPPPAPAPTAAPAATPVSTAPATSDLSKLLKFTGNSGSQSNFNGLNEQLKQAVLQAGAEYNSVTGKNLIINSAKRDAADQQRLWDETVAAGRPGIGPSGMAVGRPGASLHERGMAIDIQQGKGDQVAIGLLNKQNLYQKVPNDPVHFQFSAREGGALRGPNSGYTVQLHGDEAVIPLSGGRSIPVEIPALNASISGQMALLEVQSQQLDELIDLMRNNNGINSKILQASRA